MKERDGLQGQGREQQFRADTRIPVTLVTGFLGSGKSTLINRLLKDQHGSRIAVIVNEFGEISIDHLLIARSDDSVIELANGCLCCTVRSDLVTTLFGLYAAKVDGSVAPFDHVVIETTGIANPGPILQMLYLEEAVARRYRLASVVTTVDAVHGLATLEVEDEAISQISAADIVLLTKCDLADAEAKQRLLDEIAILNPDCVKRNVSYGRINPSLLLEDARGTRTKVLPVDHSDHEHHCEGADCHHHDHHSRHDRFVSHSVQLNSPIPWQDFVHWLDHLRRTHDKRILRIKGLVEIQETPARPLVFHAVQGIAHPPVYLDAWPSADRRTRLVFIGRDITDHDLTAGFEEFAGAQQARMAHQAESTH